MPISAGSIVKETTLFIRDLIGSNVTDPISGTRTGNSKFAVTSFPERNTMYPLVEVNARRGAAEKLGSNSESMKVPIIVTTRVWSKSKGQCDQLSDAVFNLLASNQNGSGSTETYGLFGFRQTSEADIDEPGKDGIHSKVSEYGYFVLI